jgi:hypothetical protein
MFFQWKNYNHWCFFGWIKQKNQYICNWSVFFTDKLNFQLFPAIFYEKNYIHWSFFRWKKLKVNNFFLSKIQALDIFNCDYKNLIKTCEKSKKYPKLWKWPLKLHKISWFIMGLQRIFPLNNPNILCDPQNINIVGKIQIIKRIGSKWER